MRLLPPVASIRLSPVLRIGDRPHAKIGEAHGARDRSAGRDASPDLTLETFSKVVEAIYDCALEPNHWGHALRLIADLLGSQRCVLGVHDCANDRSELAFQLGYEDEEYWKLHEGKYRGMNPHFPAVLLMRVGDVRPAPCSWMSRNSSKADST